MFTNPEPAIEKNLDEISASLRFSVVQMCHDPKSAHLGSCLRIDILSLIFPGFECET